MGSVGSTSNIASKLKAMNKEGEYRYHSTTADNLESIGKRGILPSERGYLGPGVYFAYSLEDSRQWGEEQAKTDAPIVTLRVANTYLVNTNYDDMDDTQGISQDRIPPSEVQIRQAGKWVSLKTFLRNRRR